MARTVHWLAASRFVAAFAPSFCAFGALSLVVLRLDDRVLVPLWLRLLISLLAAPALLYAKLYLQDRDHKRHADRKSVV